MLKFLLFYIVVAAVQVNVLSSPARQGNLNKYYGYTKDAPNAAIPIPSNVANNTDAPINNTLQTIVLVHGSDGDYESDLNPMVKTEILRNRDVNIIVVDWSIYAKMSYSNAAAAVPSIGYYLADFLIRLRDQGLIEFNNIHLVGFDLGAHVVGHAGRQIISLTGEQVARITGLDPAGRQWGSDSTRLTNTDASYVEIIHTDGDGILSNGIGTAIGDVDFFVNGGRSQPGCLTHACCHIRAYELFAGTFSRPTRLYGNLCTSSLQVTLNSCRSQRLHVGDDDLDKVRVNGIYRVNTGRRYPY